MILDPELFDLVDRVYLGLFLPAFLMSAYIGRDESGGHVWQLVALWTVYYIAIEVSGYGLFVSIPLDAIYVTLPAVMLGGYALGQLSVAIPSAARKFSHGVKRRLIKTPLT